PRAAPLAGEPRNELESWSARGESLVDVPREAELEAVVERMRIHRQGIALVGESQRPGLQVADADRRRERDGGDDGPHAPSSEPVARRGVHFAPPPGSVAPLALMPRPRSATGRAAADRSRDRPG